MQHLEVIPLSAIEPDKKNPRKDFGDIKALAETFKWNADNPGEPVNAIVTVKDGEIYRIVDGERRYRAMKYLKAEKCHAIVCDSMDEANVMVSMLTTDDKLKLTDVERSQGVQQMLLLGVDPVKVERVGKLCKGEGMRLNKAMILVGEKSEQLTLEHLLAIEEFKGDEDAVERMAKASAENFRRVAMEIRAEREKQAKVSALEEACAAAGIALEAEAPSYQEGYSYRDSCDDPEAIAEKHAEQPEGTKAWICEVNYGGPTVKFYAPRGAYPEEQISPEEAAIRERIAEMRDAVVVAEVRQAEWYAERINEPSTPRTDEMLIARHFANDGNEWSAMADRRKKVAKVLGEQMGDEPQGGMSGWVAAMIFNSEIETISDYQVGTFVRLVYPSNADYYRNMAQAWLGQLDAMITDGYEVTPADEAVSQMLVTYLDGEETDEEEEE